MTSQQKRRGRPKIHHDGAILDSALRVFATNGYEGMSMRSLNSELGLSHGTINQRFGTKEQLYLEAIDHGFSALLRDMADIANAEPVPDEPLEELRVRFRAFLLASARRPHLNRIINNEGVNPSPTLDRIFERYISPAMRLTRQLIAQLASDGVIEPQSDRAILFLLANGAGSVYSLPALGNKFDRLDGKVDPDAWADQMATFIINGLKRHPAAPRRTSAQPAKRSSRSATA